MIDYRPILFALGLGTVLIWVVMYPVWDWVMSVISRYAG